ncbi:MAG: efflux RND transporter periplasmic adaptor subunit [Plectolyngbya sp. WJT66-NPBG17]|jgi:HlyD family secretion protein|nr:efflux RND transporter periplasmic adaptor subunit [Plectolyngbya sp. WJT66-NPBG17]MBW4524863.1 efflux RND transporter periplasmic adaptor subunit [Phormidium tanganyikae FI6-MK23]
MQLLTSARLTFSHLGLAGVLILSGCNLIPSSDAQQQPNPQNQQGGAVAVDAEIAELAALTEERTYTGTTRPFREISLRSQAEGRITDISVNVGDQVQSGQVLARLDGTIASSAVTQAEAEVAARESEVASLQAEVEDARTQVERARLELQQARSDSQRQAQLFRQGAVSEQAAETARTALGTAEQALRSAEKQVGNRQQSVAASARRITAQQAIVSQERERQSYGVLTSPVNGSVLARPTEPGNLAQAGTEVLRVGDFNQVKVEVRVSEREFANLRVGQRAEVRLDALPNQILAGQITRISPAAETRARLIPVEVTIPNSTGRIGSGLLARVNFQTAQSQRVVVPESATQIGQKPQQGQNQAPPKSATMYVVSRSGDQASVSPREVQLGNRANGQVEILSGLKVGESFVVRSSGKLEAGAPVRLSVLSQG